MRLWFRETAVFWVFGLVSAQLQGFQICDCAKASPPIATTFLSML